MIHRKPQTREQKRNLNSHAMANKMRRYFLPSSTFPPPGITRGQTGNRNVALSAATSPNSNPTDSAKIQMVSGVGIWHYSTSFNNPPVATAIPIGQLSDGSTPGIYAQGPGTANSIIFLSANPADTRLLLVHATGSPD